uniref:Uncharacterized protein n=1 Tax=Phlebotomus papatasi TaxID=29031 RepID=A0A1B0DMK1_PHLPP
MNLEAFLALFLAFDVYKGQLSISLGFIALFLYHEPTGKWVRSHPEMWWIALILLFVTLIAMACCTNVRRKAPMNFIFLGLFTLAQSFMLGVMASNFRSEE